MRPLVVSVILVAVTILAMFTCLVQVNESEYVILARFGDPRRVIKRAGLYLKWPPPMDTVIRIDRRIHILDPNAAEYLTLDKKKYPGQRLCGMVGRRPDSLLGQRHRPSGRGSAPHRHDAFRVRHHAWGTCALGIGVYRATGADAG